MTSRVGAVSLAASPTGTGTDAAGEAMGAPGSAVPASPARFRCLVCGHDALPGDDLCGSHGGMRDGIERHAAMRQVA